MFSWRTRWTAVLIGLCALSTGFGVVELLEFDQTAGAEGRTPVVWPGSSVLHRFRQGSTLLVFVHPYCSCSVATVAELETLRADRGNVSKTILFYRPKNSGWKAGSLWSLVEDKLPGTRVVWDEGGREAQIFGARTSGYTLLYGADGRLLFRGGVTGSRGHEGANLGLEQLQVSLDTGRPAGKSLAFGCALAGVSKRQERGTL